MLTTAGQAYAEAVIETLAALNRELLERVDPDQLRAADAVLRAALADDGERMSVARRVRAPQ